MSGAFGPQSLQKQAQKKLRAFQEAEELPEVEAAGRQQRIRAIPSAAVQPVVSQQAVVFRVADDRCGFL